MRERGGTIFHLFGVISFLPLSAVRFYAFACLDS